MKRILLPFVLVAIFFSGVVAQQSPVAKHGKLSTQGTLIVDEHGRPVQLFGMSLFWSQWMGKYYTAETVAFLSKDWQCTVVRAAMGIESGGYLDNPVREKQKIFTVIDAAIREGIYVIVDWHDHHAEKHENEAVTFFTEVAKKYGHHPNIIYEIYNEPMNVSWTDVIKPYSEAVVRAIRAHDPDNLIACGSRQWSQRVDEAAADPIAGNNIVYTLHYYASTHKQELRDIAEVAISKGIVLFVTEFGITEASGDGFIDETEARKWWDFLDKHKISWCNWSVADKKENSAALRPGAGITGWKPEDLNKSGAIIRTEIRNRAK